MWCSKVATPDKVTKPVYFNAVSTEDLSRVNVVERASHLLASKALRAAETFSKLR